MNPILVFPKILIDFLYSIQRANVMEQRANVMEQRANVMEQHTAYSSSLKFNLIFHFLSKNYSPFSLKLLYT